MKVCDGGASYSVTVVEMPSSSEIIVGFRKTAMQILRR
jgi:hypothetical protein